jgi:hypothetical protein
MSKSLRAIVIMVFLLVASWLCPPWTYTTQKLGKTVESDWGHYFIFLLPSGGAGTFHVDTGKLVLTDLCIVAIFGTAAGIAFARSRPTGRTPSP